MPLPARKKILIIEDNADFRKELSQRLHKAGYQVFQAIDEPAAFEILEDIKMDLIFLGQLGAAYSRKEFLRKLRRTFLGRDVPLLMTPPVEQETRDVIKKDQGVECLINWPMKMEDLLLRVDKLASRFDLAAPPKYKVLVAGAQRDVIEDMTRQLQKKGYEAQSAVSGSETISKAVQMTPDVLVMDVLMDGVLSQDIIQILRQMPQFEKNPILTYCYYRLSDLDREEVREKVLGVEVAVRRCQEAGADEYIGRYNENAFLEIINKYLS